ncbi:MAG TPA: peptide-methionine (R)-S-oxide reductase MsrB [Balneolaceae bacterium]|nr:peptide-methionine (R)-S-oxide reductase MsrB [Balneolaceae bacterium]
MLNWKQVNKYVKTGNPEPPKRVEKTEEEWKELLTDKQFKSTRKAATDARFEGEYCKNYEPGLYSCICCGTKLFNAHEKFKSGSGWPSFTQPIEENLIKYKKDSSLGMNRIEAKCNICDAHLGHVFPDGPRPTGLRYCLNSTSLELE